MLVTARDPAVAGLAAELHRRFVEEAETMEPGRRELSAVRVEWELPHHLKLPTIHMWDTHEAWQKSKARIPEPPSSYYYGRIFGCFTADYHGLHSLAEVGEDNICFEPDYPHTDTTWPNSKEYIEKMLADFDDDLAYKVLRGHAIRMLELAASEQPRLTIPAGVNYGCLYAEAAQNARRFSRSQRRAAGGRCPA